MVYLHQMNLQKRHILQWMICSMVIVNTMVTISLNIDIISMVNFNEGFENSEHTNNIVCPNRTFFLQNFLNIEVTNEKLPNYQNISTLKWSKEECEMVLGGYYKITYIAILPAGVLAHKYGPKVVAGYGQLISSCMSSLIPLLATYEPIVVTWIRAIQGALSFMAVPAGMYVIIANWSPLEERGMFAASAIVGSGIGQTLGSICFGYIARYISWQSVFHLTSIIGVIWAILWYMLVYDFPRDHPTITREEKVFIETRTESNINPLQSVIPWKSIVTSIPFITSVLASNASIWFFVMVITYKPIFLKSMYGMNSDEVGVISGLCLFLTTVLALVVGYVIDYSMKKKLMSLTTMRKICSSLGCVISCIPLIMIVSLKCNINLVIICFSFVSILKGFSMHGAPMAVVDMSSRFCGALEGISGTLSSFSTFIFSTIITHYSGAVSVEDLWKYTFYFTALFSILTHSIYLIYGSSKIQSWNFEKPVTVNSLELQNGTRFNE